MNEDTDIDVSADMPVREQSVSMFHLKNLLDADSGVVFATLSTVDGFEIASVSIEQANDENRGKLAAISSALQALSMAAVQELALAPLHSLTVEGQSGRMLTIEIPAGTRSLILSVVALKPSLLASSLFATRNCALKIAASLATLHTAAFRRAD